MVASCKVSVSCTGLQELGVEALGWRSWQFRDFGRGDACQKHLAQHILAWP
jgi:hypothetical protein